MYMVRNISSVEFRRVAAKNELELFNVLPFRSTYPKGCDTSYRSSSLS